MRPPAQQETLLEKPNITGTEIGGQTPTSRGCSLGPTDWGLRPRHYHASRRLVRPGYRLEVLTALTA